MRPQWLTRFAALAVLALPGTMVAQAVNLETIPPLRLVEEVRIGHHDDPNLGFSRIGSVAVDRDGNVYASDLQAFEIRVYSPAGTLLRKIGRRGQGPGEFQSAVSIGLKGDTLWTSEINGGCGAKISLFKRDGTFLTSITSPGHRVVLRQQIGNRGDANYRAGNLGVGRPMAMRADGKYIGGEVTCYTIGPELAAGAPGPGPNDTVRVPRILFDAKGLPTDTLGWYRLPPTPSSGPRDTIAIEGIRHPIPTPPSDAPLNTGLLDGRVTIQRPAPATTAQASIRVVRTGLSGNTIYDRTFRYTPVAYSAAALDTVAAQSSRAPRGMVPIINGVPTPTPFNNPEAAQAAIRKQLKFPAYQTPVRNVVPGEDASLWLMREDRGGATYRWLVLDPQGQPRGTLDAPRTFRAAWVQGSIVWGVVLDEDDVPWLVRYRLEVAR